MGRNSWGVTKAVFFVYCWLCFENRVSHLCVWIIGCYYTNVYIWTSVYASHLKMFGLANLLWCIKVQVLHSLHYYMWGTVVKQFEYWTGILFVVAILFCLVCCDETWAVFNPTMPLLEDKLYAVFSSISAEIKSSYRIIKKKSISVQYELIYLF